MYYLRSSLSSASVLFLFCACTHAPVSPPPQSLKVEPAPQKSAAYQYALNQAFADLKNQTKKRGPADEASRPHFSQVQDFVVLVYPKVNTLGHARGAQAIQSKLGAPMSFHFHIDREEHCQQGAEVVPAREISNCIQVEIKPSIGNKKSRQMVRLFMDEKYHVYGLSYHALNPQTGQPESHRRLIKWDPSEPLSSELLSLTSEIAPIDLPLYASNGLKQSHGRIRWSQAAASVAPKDCSGLSSRYKNTFGSNIKATWCDGDPWPSSVETNRYLSVLSHERAMSQ